jgi:transmembrane sensor
MIDYQTCDAETLATDDWFCAWVLHESPEATRFWDDWLRQHPARADTVAEARQMAHSLADHLQQTQTHAPSDFVRTEAARIVQLVQSAEHTDRDAPGKIIPFYPVRRWHAWAAAAVLVLCLGVGWSIWQQQITRPTGESMVSAIGENRLVIHVNRTGQTASLLLPDGSVVMLEPNSRLTHPARFLGNSRRVSLQGDAFFEVARNPKQPFLIVAGNTITRVVGTSFRIRMGKAGVTVAVRSGKVLVYRETDAPTDTQPAPNAVALTANEQVMLGQPDVAPQKTLVQQSALIETRATQETFQYDDAPLPVVLRALETLYGVSFDYDQANLKDCPITCSFDEENFPERLDIICKSVGLTHEVRNGRIVLGGRGCH